MDGERERERKNSNIGRKKEENKFCKIHKEKQIHAQGSGVA
jgi:hypothetical protein